MRDLAITVFVISLAFLYYEEVKDWLFGGPDPADTTITLEDFKKCDSKGGSYYKNECQGESLVVFAIVGGHTDDGVGLKLKDSCGAIDRAFTVDAENLDYEYSKSNKDRCVEIVAKVGAKNFITPDIRVFKTLWVETASDVELREEEADRLAAEKEALERGLTPSEWKVLQARIKACKSDWQSCGDNENLIEHYGKMPEIKTACQRVTDQSAKYGDPDWSWVPFGTYYTGNAYIKTGIARLVDENVKIMNGFGSMVNAKVECAYNLRTESASLNYIKPR
jgi:hypothetical protein